MFQLYVFVRCFVFVLYCSCSLLILDMLTVISLLCGSFLARAPFSVLHFVLSCGSEVVPLSVKATGMKETRGAGNGSRRGALTHSLAPRLFVICTLYFALDVGRQTAVQCLLFINIYIYRSIDLESYQDEIIHVSHWARSGDIAAACPSVPRTRRLLQINRAGL